MTRNPRRRWTILATALTTMFALLMPLAVGAQAADNDFDLNVNPESVVNETNTQHTLTADITTAGGCSQAGGCQIDFDVETGPGQTNDHLNPDMFCTIAQGASQCGVSFTSTSSGENRVRGWVDDDNDNSTFDGDGTERASAQSVPGDRPETDDTDVVTATWATTGEPDRVEATPTSASVRYGDDRTISCQIFDGFNNAVGGANCDAHVTNGPNTDYEGVTPGHVGQCTTGAAGEPCPITYTSSEVGTDEVMVFADYNTSNNEWDGGNDPEPFTSVSSVWTSDIKSGPCADLNYNSSRAKPGGGRIIAGSPEANTINGGPGPDTICALGGNDTVDGNGGNDHVLAGLGWDNVVGEGGDDNLDGNEGRDTLNGGDGIDSIVAGGHNDIMVGGGGNDVMKGQDGTDALRGKGGADTMEGGTDADILFGHSGNDTLKGGGGNDELDGGIGRDTCISGPGRDQVRRCEQ